MDTVYIKDPQTGQFIPDRRGNNMELQQAVLKLLAKVESMEVNIETKLESVKDKIGNIDEKLTNRVDVVEKKIDNHCNDEDSINDTLIEHDKKLENAKSYIDRIHKLETKYTQLEIRVDQLESKPTKSKAQFVDDFFKILKNIFFTILATTLVGFIGYLIVNYIKGG